jgi:hypothetical protein
MIHGTQNAKGFKKNGHCQRRFSINIMQQNALTNSGRFSFNLYQKRQLFTAKAQSTQRNSNTYEEKILNQSGERF